MQLTAGQWKVLCHRALTLPEISQQHQRRCRRDVTTQPPPTAAPGDGLHSNQMRLSKRFTHLQWQCWLWTVSFWCSGAFRRFPAVCLSQPWQTRLILMGKVRCVWSCGYEAVWPWNLFRPGSSLRCPVRESGCRVQQQCQANILVPRVTGKQKPKDNIITVPHICHCKSHIAPNKQGSFFFLKPCRADLNMLLMPNDFVHFLTHEKGAEPGFAKIFRGGAMCCNK